MIGNSKTKSTIFVWLVLNIDRKGPAFDVKHITIQRLLGVVARKILHEWLGVDRSTRNDDMKRVCSSWVGCQLLCDPKHKVGVERPLVGFVDDQNRDSNQEGVLLNQAYKCSIGHEDDSRSSDPVAPSGEAN